MTLHIYFPSYSGTSWDPPSPHGQGGHPKSGKKMFSASVRVTLRLKGLMAGTPLLLAFGPWLQEW